MTGFRPDSDCTSTLPEAWADDLHWFALQTKPRGEDLAAHAVGTLGVETLLPKVRPAPTRRSAAPAPRPLFPGYLFSRLRLRQHLHPVRYTRGVIRIVGCGSRPVPVDDQVIEACRERMDGFGFVELDEPGLRRGDRVQIESGPFAGFQGVFSRETDDPSRVVVLLEALRQAQLVLDRRHVVAAVA